MKIIMWNIIADIVAYLFVSVYILLEIFLDYILPIAFFGTLCYIVLVEIIKDVVTKL